jgi:hypothetical protein
MIGRAVAILYGVFALAYDGDGSSPTYVTMAGHRLDAHLAGAISVALGITLAACGRATIGAGRGRRIPVWANRPSRR